MSESSRRPGRPTMPRMLLVCSTEGCQRGVIRREREAAQRNRVFCLPCIEEKRTQKVKKCVACGAEFTVWRGSNLIRCDACRPKTTPNKSRSAYTYTRVCEHCQQQFDAYEPPTRGRARFCSDEHRLAWFSQHYRGDRSPHWKDGSTLKYGPVWKPLARAVRNRDEHMCRNCGKTEDETGKRHDVAHLIPEGAYEYPTAVVHHPGNLVALCKSCHTSFDRHSDTRWDYVTGSRPVWPDWAGQPVGLQMDRALTVLATVDANGRQEEALAPFRDRLVGDYVALARRFDGRNYPGRLARDGIAVSESQGQKPPQPHHQDEATDPSWWAVVACEQDTRMPWWDDAFQKWLPGDAIEVREAVRRCAVAKARELLEQYGELV